MPFRSAIIRALARSGEGSRSAICTLPARASFATSFEPSGPITFRADNCCFRNARPSAQDHHLASSCSLANRGTDSFLTLRFSIFSTFPQAILKVVPLLSRVQIVSCNYANFFITLSQNDGPQSKACGFAIVNVARLSVSVLLVDQNRTDRKCFLYFYSADTMKFDLLEVVPVPIKHASSLYMHRICLKQIGNRCATGGPRPGQYAGLLKNAANLCSLLPAGYPSGSSLSNRCGHSL